MAVEKHMTDCKLSFPERMFVTSTRYSVRVYPILVKTRKQQQLGDNWAPGALFQPSSSDLWTSDKTIARVWYIAQTTDQLLRLETCGVWQLQWLQSLIINQLTR